MDLLRRVQKFLHENPEFDIEQGIVVGVSGGPDSLTLLHLLHRLPVKGRKRVWAAHLDHALRSDSPDDARFVDDIANDWGFSAIIERRDVRSHAALHRISVEEAGRQVRYEFLAQVAHEHGATTILVAHQAEDQAETVLMHLLRGAGLSGLRGMRALTRLSELHLSEVDAGRLLLGRPLLSSTRAEITSYCVFHGLQPRTDASNADMTIFRNRMRHEILPSLQSVNPNIQEVLRRMSDVAAADYLVLCQARDTAWDETIIDCQDDQLAFDRVAFEGLLPGLRRSIIRAAIERLRPDLRDVQYSAVAYAADFSRTAAVGRRTPLPGTLALAVDYDRLMIAPEGTSRTMPSEFPRLLPGELSALPVPGRVELLGCGWRAETDDLGEIPLETVIGNKDHWLAYLDADRLRSPLTLRSRRTGERFQPLGLHGHSQSVADFMTNSKVPQSWRDQLPLLVSGDQIAWIPGWRIDHRMRVREGAHRVCRVRLVRGD